MVQQAASTAARRSARRERSFRRRSCYECSAPFAPLRCLAHVSSWDGASTTCTDSTRGPRRSRRYHSTRGLTTGHGRETSFASHDDCHPRHATREREPGRCCHYYKVAFHGKQLDPPKRQPTQPKLPHETEITVTSMVSYTWRYDHQTKVTPSDRTAHSFLLGQITRGYSSYVEIVFAGVGTRQSVNT